MDVIPQNVPSDEQEHQPLTKKECREIVTPYAFMVADDLLGTPLATPWRRAAAMAIDGIIIAGLASASLLFILPVMLYLCWLRYQLKKYTHLVALLLATLLLSTTATVAPELISEQKDIQTNNLADDRLDAAGSAALAFSVLRLNRDDCKGDCIVAELKSSSQQLAKAGVPAADARELLTDLLEVTELSSKAKKALIERELKSYHPVDQVPAVEAKAVPASDAKVLSTETSEKPWYQPSENTQSIIGWVKGILADFGLGYGWAMFYFTAYIHWAHGQTIGKMLCKIKVIQLDGQELDVFAAFSRQGGYGAGFATGLMGFLQVFWDPNRQAIHDKIASTVVIRLNQPKRPLHH